MADPDLQRSADAEPTPRWAVKEDARNRRENQFDETEGRRMVIWALGPPLVAVVVAVWRWLF